MATSQTTKFTANQTRPFAVTVAQSGRIAFRHPGVSLLAPQHVGTLPPVVTSQSLHALDIASGAPLITVPNLAQGQQLTASDIASGVPLVGVPGLSQAMALSATDISAGAPAITAPSIAQCNIEVQSQTTQYSSYSEQIGDISERQWVATKFVAADDANICTVAGKLQNKVGSPTGYLTLYIYSHDSANDCPDSQIGTGSDYLDVSTFSTSAYTWYNFQHMDVDIINGTTYWLVGKTSFVDSSNYSSWAIGNTAGSYLWGSSDGVNWTKDEGVYVLLHKLFDDQA